MYGNMTIDEFKKVLSSKSPTPGGGGAAALTAVLAASLSSMVFNLTVGKKLYEAYDDDTKELVLKSLKQSDVLRDEFVLYIDKDAEAFLNLIKAYKMPKNTEEEKQARSQVINERYVVAAEVPMELALKANSLYGLIEVACKYGNKNAVSDAGAAAILIHSALETAVLNITINLHGIKNINLRNKFEEDSKCLLDKSKIRKNEILDAVYRIMGQ